MHMYRHRTIVAFTSALLVSRRYTLGAIAESQHHHTIFDSTSQRLISTTTNPAAATTIATSATTTITRDTMATCTDPNMYTQLRDEASAFVNEFNNMYEKKHEAFEQQFWGTKMALKDTADVTYSAENLSKTKKDMEDLLSDPTILEKAVALHTALLASNPATASSESKRDDTTNNTINDSSVLLKILSIIVRTCNCYTMSPVAKAFREKCSQYESQLEVARNQMKLGYMMATTNGTTNTVSESKEEPNDISTTTATSTTFVEASSVALRNLVRTSPDEAIRQSAYDGLRSIGTFVLHNGFIEIIKLRNQLAKALGFLDYYDYKVTNAEGFGKLKLFEMLDGLEQGTRSIMNIGRKELVTRHGEDVLQPWNTGYKMAGSIIVKMDPYFPFSKSVERYVRSYAALNIRYEGATMNLDLLDRKNKYSNGFCHWPKPAWIKSDGSWQPAVTNFTSLADPKAIGSGLTALQTLMHEAGHAAHFANIKQPSPLFSQERAPTSVAYAENQSMFLDSLVGDAAWRARYALDTNGTPLPFEIIEEEIRAVHPFAVFQLRAMLAVSYFEKALYELPEEEVTVENVQALADSIELEIQGGFSGRPLFSIPHLVSDEASCYYHGYTLAEMSVHQTRAYFKNKYGYIVDNPNVGPEITKAYWESGNSRPFLDLVRDLTGKDLSGSDWIASLNESVEDKVIREREEYDNAIQNSSISSINDNIDLNMTVKFVDGDEIIADSSLVNGGILEACQQFEAFVAARIASS
jgi:Peptidase family M3